MAKAESRVPILMTKDERGGIDGYFVMQFQKGKVYLVNVSLARAFVSMEVGVISEIPESGAYHLHLSNGGRAEWRLVPKVQG